MSNKLKNTKLFKFLLKIWKLIDRDDVLSPEQTLALDIFKICLYDKNNVRFLYPNNTNRYIVSREYVLQKEIKTYIILKKSGLSIVNHHYKYPVYMPEKTLDKMEKMFDSQVEKERDKMEEEINNNITQSLEIVLTKFKNKLEQDNTN